MYDKISCCSNKNKGVFIGISTLQSALHKYAKTSETSKYK